MRVEAALCDSLSFMEQGLVFGEPLQLTGEPAMNWFLYTDAAYEPTTHTGSIGAVLTDNSGKVVSWFGIQLDCEVCEPFCALKKGTRKYELEMAAVVFAFLVWGRQVSRGLQVWFGDNDSVRFAFKKSMCRRLGCKQVDACASQQ